MNEFLIIITGILGATTTFYVSHRLKQGSVRASALLSLMVGLFFYTFPNLVNPFLTVNIPIVFIGTSFIGMVSLKTKRKYIQLTVAGILFSVIYLNKRHIFDGFGGALGALALISLLITLGGSVAFKKSSIKLLLSLRKKSNE